MPSAPGAPPRPVTTDRCSRWPDRLFGVDYGGCCEKHDEPYGRGGPAPERLEADIELLGCVARKFRWTWLGRLVGIAMFVGVSIGGCPWWPTRFRWGYGWPWPRGYHR